MDAVEKAKPCNPWREFIENVINGDNYFRSSEYRELLEYIDELLDERAALSALSQGDSKQEPAGFRERLDRIFEARHTYSQYPDVFQVVWDSVMEALDEASAAAPVAAQQQYDDGFENARKFLLGGLHSDHPAQAPQQEAGQARELPLTDGDINEITLAALGKWPSFEAQSWACKVVRAVTAQAAPAVPERRNVQTITMFDGDEITLRRETGWDEQRVVWNRAALASSPSEKEIEFLKAELAEKQKYILQLERSRPSAKAAVLTPESIEAAMKKAELGMGSYGPKYDGAMLADALQTLLEDVEKQGRSSVGAVALASAKAAVPDEREAFRWISRQDFLWLQRYEEVGAASIPLLNKGGGSRVALYLASAPAQTVPEGWRLVSEHGQPQEGLYLALYRDGPDSWNLPVALLSYGDYEYYSDENPAADDEGMVRGIGWSEEVESDGEYSSLIYVRDVVAYLPTNFDGASLETVRKAIAAAAPVAQHKEQG